jgi:hypothetical protein
MNRDDIIKLALEAGFCKDSNGIYSRRAVTPDSDLLPSLERFAALVAAAEREACAKVCEKQIKSYMSKQYTTDPLGGFRERFAAEQCAAAIRARGEV